MRTCRGNECGEQIDAETCSKANPAYCPACGDPVYAARINSDLPDEWFLVSVEEPLIGTSMLAGNQCGVCGLSEFMIVSRGAHEWVALCAGQNVDGSWIPGCGTEHPVRQKMGAEVIW